MKNKIIVKIDVTKISKDKIKDRKYTNKDNVEVVAKEYDFEIVPLKSPKFIKRGKTQDNEEWQLLKTGFVVEKKANKEDPDVFLGDALEFEKIEQNASNIPSETYEEVTYEKEEDKGEDIPF